MFIGHFALGFAAKRAAPRTSLATLFAAVALADLIWPVLVAAGVEQVRIDPGNTAFTPLDFVSYPYSHSLVLLVVWGAAFAYAVTGAGRPRAGGELLPPLLLYGGLVVSHWVLDFVVHRADLPLYPGSAKFGLALWDSVPATIVVESLMYAAGVVIYARATHARNRTGSWGFVVLVLLLAASYAANVLGGPPPSVSAIVVVGTIGGTVTLVLAWWADRNRSGRSGARHQSDF